MKYLKKSNRARIFIVMISVHSLMCVVLVAISRPSVSVSVSYVLYVRHVKRDWHHCWKQNMLACRQLCAQMSGTVWVISYFSFRFFFCMFRGTEMNTQLSITRFWQADHMWAMALFLVMLHLHYVFFPRTLKTAGWLTITIFSWVCQHTKKNDRALLLRSFLLSDVFLCAFSRAFLCGIASFIGEIFRVNAQEAIRQ